MPSVSFTADFQEDFPTNAPAATAAATAAAPAAHAAATTTAAAAAAASTPRLLNQGSFGCVYLPEVPCQATSRDPPSHPYAKQYISKIQVLSQCATDRNLSQKQDCDDQDTKVVEGEIAIGKLVMTLPNYSRFFAPIVHHCDVDIAEFHPDDVQECEVMKHRPSDARFVSNKIRYVGRNSIKNHLTQLLDVGNCPSRLEQEIHQTYHHLSKALAYLINLDVVHFDVKNGNILMDDLYGVPIFIDFGISFQPKKMLAERDATKRNQLYNDAFYSFYENYRAWPIQVIFLSYCTEKLFRRTHDIETDKTDATPDYLADAPPLQLSDPVPVAILTRIFDHVLTVNDVFQSIRDMDAKQGFRQRVVADLAKRAESQQTVQAFMDDLVATTSASWDTFALAVVYHFFLVDHFEHPAASALPTTTATTATIKPPLTPALQAFSKQLQDIMLGVSLP